MRTTQIALILAVGLTLCACSTKEVQEPSEASMLGALTECAGGACKEFKKASCQKNVIDPASPGETQFKCKYGYVSAAGPKSEEKCFIQESGSWRVAVCLG